MTIPGKPTSSKQKYRLTPKGRDFIGKLTTGAILGAYWGLSMIPKNGSLRWISLKKSITFYVKFVKIGQGGKRVMKKRPRDVTLADKRFPTQNNLLLN